MNTIIIISSSSSSSSSSIIKFTMLIKFSTFPGFLTVGWSQGRC